MFLLQAVYAGQFLSETFGALQNHQNNAGLADLVLLAILLPSLLMRWPGKGSIWFLFTTLRLMVLSFIQSSIGYSRVLTLHIPLGVVIILLSTLTAVLA